MTQWPSTKAKRVLRALLSIGWQVKRQTGSHRTLARPGWPDYVFSFHDSDEIGPRMLTRIAKHTGLQTSDLQIRQTAFRLIPNNGRYTACDCLGLRTAIAHV